MNSEIRKAGVSGVQSNPELKARFFKEFEQLFNEKPCEGCKSKLAGYIKQYLNKSDMSEEIQYEFKEKIGGTALFTWRGMDVTNANVNKLMKAKSGEKYPIGAHMFADSDAFKKYFASTPGNHAEMVAAIKGAKPEPVSFQDELVALDNIGKATAVKIIAEYDSAEKLAAAIAEGEDLPFKEGVVEVLTTTYGS